MVRTASWQTADKSLKKWFLPRVGLADWTMTESLWQFDRVLSHKNKSIFIEDAICAISGLMNSQTKTTVVVFFSFRKLPPWILPLTSNERKNILHGFHINAWYHHQHKQFSRKNLICAVKYSEILYIKGCDSLWYRWQTFSYAEHEVNMNERWDVASTALRGINTKKTTWGTLRHEHLKDEQTVQRKSSWKCLTFPGKGDTCFQDTALRKHHWKATWILYFTVCCCFERSSWKDNWCPNYLAWLCGVEKAGQE